MGQSSGIPGTYISVCFGRGGKLRHELYVDTGDGAENDALFEDLLKHRETLESAYGRPSTFSAFRTRGVVESPITEQAM